MANKFYPLGKEKMLLGQINWASDTIKAALVSNTYTYSDAHEFLDSIQPFLLGAAQTLTSKTITAGVFDADDVTFAALAAGSTIKAVVLYKDTGNATNSPLLAYLDNVTGFPMPTFGGDVVVPWSNSVAKIFAL